MDNVFIDLGDDLQIGNGDSFTIGEDNLLSESETLVGPPGPPGSQGPKGEPGRDGQDGRSATIEIGTTTTGQPGTDASVVNSGTESQAVLNFTIPRGEQGIQGIQGEPGEDGDDGAAATISVGSVQTVAPEYPATVTNSGTTSAAILDFQIPQGVAGQDGADGQDGAPGQAATIAVGTTTTGNPGTNASVTNSGTSSAAVFNFVIPRGADGQNGQDGQDGAPGQAATIAVGTTTTGAAGTNATVTNSGSSSAAVFNFTIPRGADGQNGQDGQDGIDGVTPSITASATVSNTTGTPSCTVTKSGTDANPNFAFAFTNIKGADGTTPTLDSLPSSSISHIGTLNDFKCNKFLGLVILNLSITLSTTTSWQDIFTLPSGWRPSIAVSPAVMVADKIAQNHEIQTNGVFHARFNSSGSTTLRVMAVYNTA